MKTSNVTIILALTFGLSLGGCNEEGASTNESADIAPTLSVTEQIGDRSFQFILNENFLSETQEEQAEFCKIPKAHIFTPHVEKKKSDSSLSADVGLTAVPSEGEEFGIGATAPRYFDPSGNAGNADIKAIPLGDENIESPLSELIDDPVTEKTINRIEFAAGQFKAYDKNGVLALEGNWSAVDADTLEFKISGKENRYDVEVKNDRLIVTPLDAKIECPPFHVVDEDKKDVSSAKEKNTDDQKVDELEDYLMINESVI